MRKFIYLFFTLLILSSCSDGDVLEVELAFDQVLDFCDQSTTSYLVYDIKEEDPYESLSLLFPKNATTALIFAPEENNYSVSFDINGSSVRFNYRTYDGNPQNLLCALVPDPSTHILNNYESTSGLVTTLTTFVDDDEDGIPSNVEDLNLDGDDDPATNPTDSDGDGIPDYKDADDDNDNILTKFENPNYTVANGLADAQNTDADLPNGDTIPDYLDTDDDGDGVLTRYEDEDADLNPRNDIDETSPTEGLPARYLDPAATESFQATIDLLAPDDFVPNTFTRTYNVNFKLTLIDLQILSTDEIELGDYKYPVTIE